MKWNSQSSPCDRKCLLIQRERERAHHERRHTKHPIFTRLIFQFKLFLVWRGFSCFYCVYSQIRRQLNHERSTREREKWEMALMIHAYDSNREAVCYSVIVSFTFAFCLCLGKWNPFDIFSAIFNFLFARKKFTNHLKWTAATTATTTPNMKMRSSRKIAYLILPEIYFWRDVYKPPYILWPI